MTRALVVGLVAVLALAACSDDDGGQASGPATAVASPLPSPTDATDATSEPAAAASPSPSPSAAASPSPSPSPSASPSPSPSPSASPAEPVLTEAAALAAARRRQAERGDCDTGIAAEAHRVVATVDQRFLVHVVCFVGAYQPSGELRVWDGVELLAVPVEQWQSGAVVDTAEVVGFVDGAPASTTVVNDVRYRGLGDCGLQQRWTFDGSGLRLDLAREQQCTDDGEFVPPGSWPVVYER